MTESALLILITVLICCSNLSRAMFIFGFMYKSVLVGHAYTICLVRLRENLNICMLKMYQVSMNIESVDSGS